MGYTPQLLFLLALTSILHRMGAESICSLPSVAAYGFTPCSEVSMFGSSLTILSALVIVAVMSIYFPSVYIRKTNVMISLLEKIEANTRK